MTVGCLSSWTVAQLPPSADIEFQGPGAESLGGIRDIVLASQISNLAAYGPTDCATHVLDFVLATLRITL